EEHLGGSLQVVFGTRDVTLDLLLEKRVHDDGRGAGVLEPPDGIEIIDQRRRSRHEWMRQAKAEPARRQIHASSSALRGRHRARELLIQGMPLVHVFLCPDEKGLEPVGVALLDHPEARLVAHELVELALRWAGIELERTLGLPRVARIEAIERPVPGIDGTLLLGASLGEIVPVRDAMRI